MFNVLDFGYVYESALKKTIPFTVASRRIK